MTKRPPWRPISPPSQCMVSAGSGFGSFHESGPAAWAPQPERAMWPRAATRTAANQRSVLTVLSSIGGDGGRRKRRSIGTAFDEGQRVRAGFALESHRRRRERFGERIAPACERSAPQPARGVGGLLREVLAQAGTGLR